MDNTLLVIESDRLKLVAVHPDHMPEIFTEFNEEVTRYMYPRPAKEISETEAWVIPSRQKMQEGRDFSFSIFTKDTNEFIGCGGVHNLDNPFPEFGIWTKVSSWGKHYGSEAVTAGYLHFKDSYLGFLYPADTQNSKSLDIPKRLNGVWSKAYDHENMSGRVLNIEEYVVPGNNEAIRETKRILLEHQQKYPMSTIKDYLKLLYQNVFGPKHLHSNPDRAQVISYLEQELTEVSVVGQEIEDIGNGYVRIPLGIVKSGRISLEQLAEAFLKSMDSPEDENTRNSFIAKAAVLQLLAKEGHLWVPYEQARQAIEDFIRKGIAPTHHSEIYREKYQPHYRVVKRSVLE